MPEPGATETIITKPPRSGEEAQAEFEAKTDRRLDEPTPVAKKLGWKTRVTQFLKLIKPRA